MMKKLNGFSHEAVLQRSLRAKRELDAAARSAQVKKDLGDASMDKKERRPLKEFSDLRNELIGEQVDIHSGSMPPNILILRRKTVRQFPGGLMVALYFNDKLNQYFSIPYGSAGADDAVVTPVSLKEEEHQVGDEVRYRLGADAHLRVGKVKQVTPEHLVVKREGSHYKVGKDTVVHNTRTGYTREELNEISIPTATSAYYKRQAKGEEALEKKDYKSAIPHLSKAHRTIAFRAKKFARSDRGEIVKEETITEDVISHLKKVKEFGTDKPLYHKDGTQTRIDPTTARALLTVHGALHPDNQKKMADAMEHSNGKFHRILNFAWKQIKE